ncbi:alpha/beta hydrolase [Streptomyces sp. NPDC092296]|uniref:alpha/beta hydrolase n=1 Tax=Streptomyces sp. NPDC092296 TaxID=3366012 RepID=UPI00382C79E4
MGLTSQTLLVVVSLVAVACVVATVWTWPRLAKRHWAAVLGRLGTILVTQLLTLAALGLVVNNYFSFYASWGDLLGTSGNQPVTVTNHLSTGGGSGPGTVYQTGVQSLGRVRVAGLGDGGPQQSGVVERVRISGGRSGLAEDGYVYLPPQYFRADYAHRRLPVVVALTGYPGDAHNLVTRLNLPKLELDLLGQGRMQPTVLVLLRPTVTPPRDTECQDVPHGPQAETFFVRDVPKALGQTYRVAAGGHGWGIIGDSTGGYCALKLTMRHPEAYSAAVSLSGYYQSAVDATTGDLFGGSARLRRENDLLWRLRHLASPPVSVLLASSREGEHDYEATQSFIAAVRPPMKVASITLDSGGHNFRTWNRELPVALPWLAEQLKVG